MHRKDGTSLMVIKASEDHWASSDHTTVKQIKMSAPEEMFLALIVQ